MKKTLISLIAVAVTGIAGAAVADEATNGPVMMTDTQLDTVVAGKTFNVWTDMDGDYLVNGNPNLAAEQKAGHQNGKGGNKGWNEYQTSCDSDGSCLNGGTIEYGGDVIDGGTGEWTYTPPVVILPL